MKTAIEEHLTMSKPARGVLRFMEACQQLRNTDAGFNAQTGLWLGMIREEFSELITAFDYAATEGTPERFAELLDGICDLVYVTIGLAHNMGMPFDEAFAEVQKTNMAKVDPTTGLVTRREDGKILKPEGWVPPNLIQFIKLEKKCETPQAVVTPKPHTDAFVAPQRKTPPPPLP